MAVKEFRKSKPYVGCTCIHSRRHHPCRLVEGHLEYIVDFYVHWQDSEEINSTECGSVLLIGTDFSSCIVAHYYEILKNGQSAEYGPKAIFISNIYGPPILPPHSSHISAQLFFMFWAQSIHLLPTNNTAFWLTLTWYSIYRMSCMEYLVLPPPSSGEGQSQFHMTDTVPFDC